MTELYRYLDRGTVYVITYPGPDSLADGMKNEDDRTAFETIIRRTRDVIAEHGMESVRKVLVVHSECAGHEVSDDAHQRDGRETAAILNRELNLRVPFVALMGIRRLSDYDWSIVEC